MSDTKIEISFNDLLKSIMDNVAAMQKDVATLTANSLNHTEALKRIESATKEEHTKLGSRIDKHDDRITGVEQDMIACVSKLSGAVKATGVIWIVSIAVIGILISMRGLK